MSYALAIDVGGTFTDLVLTDPRDGRLWISKVPSAGDPIDSVLSGAAKVCELAGIGREEVASIHFGTTAAVNVLLTRRGATVGLLTTQGFGQILHLARSQTPGPLVGWLNWTKPEPLADLAHTREIHERMRADGAVETPVDEDGVRRQVQALAREGVEALAIVFLHSYANPAHEQRAAELAAEVADLPVTLSSDVLPEYREYERAVTTVVNAYITPAVSHYLVDFESRLAAEGFGARLNVVRSDGGLMSSRAAAARAVSTVYSGPSGGVSGALEVARRAGFRDILTLDMGGTSTDVSVCLRGEAVITQETIVGEIPIRSSSVDVRSVGAGGGSIAWIPEMVRSLRVGPDSAGAEPGPVCYGRGGTQPTVTDANLVLGRLPGALLGGEMSIDHVAANAAIEELAGKVGIGALPAAQGIIDIADEHMAGALRVMSVERGLDPRRFALVAFGGAGPLHANALATRLGCYPVIVPPSPGVLSAFGFHTVGRRNSFTRTMIRVLNEDSTAAIVEAFDSTSAEATLWLTDEGESEGTLGYSCDLRFLRQGYEIEVPFSQAELHVNWLPTISLRFREMHERLYGFVPEAEVEAVNLRVEIRGGAELSAATREPRAGDGAQALVGTDRVHVDGDWHTADIYRRDLLEAGDRFAGPAIVNQVDSTTLVLPGHDAEIDGSLNILIRPKEGADHVRG